MAGLKATGGSVLNRHHAVNKSMDFQEPLRPDDGASLEGVDLDNSSVSSREGDGKIQSEIRAQDLHNLKVASLGAANKGNQPNTSRNRPGMHSFVETESSAMSSQRSLNNKKTDIPAKLNRTAQLRAEAAKKKATEAK